LAAIVPSPSDPDLCRSSLSVAVGWLSEGPRLPRQPPSAAGRRGVDTGPDEWNRGCPGKRDRGRRQPCRERRGLPESAGQPLGM